jgi:hypothetical protein
MFEAAFSTHDDETLADAACAWIAHGAQKPPGSFSRHLTRRLESDAPFSPRLRWMVVREIERNWHGELEAAGLETIRLLNGLEAGIDDVVDEDAWGSLLVSAICLPSCPEGLSTHNWHVLDGLVSSKWDDRPLPLRNVEVMRSLEEARDWEKLDVWMRVIWKSRRSPTSAPMEDVERVTLELLSQRPYALQRFEELYEQGLSLPLDREALRRICDEALAKRPPPELPAPS